MSSYQTKFEIALNPENCKEACLNAMAISGWILTQKQETLLIGEEMPQGMFTNPAQIEIQLNKENEKKTSLFLKTSNFGFGPFQANHVKKLGQQLIKQIQQEAYKISSSPQKEKNQIPKKVVQENVVLNGLSLEKQQIQQFEQRYNIRLQSGNFWYDRMTGAWGLQGGPTSGFILPNLELGGPLAENASNGNTNIFINGRQLHTQDVLGLQQILPVVIPGRYWMDAQGNFGTENGPILGNIWAMAQSSGVKKEGILSTYDKTGIAVIGY